MILTCAIFITAPAAHAAENSNSIKSDKADKSNPTDGITSAVLQTQVLLDRVMFSPGAIDGLKGRNFSLALEAFQKANNLEGSGEMNDQTSETLRNGAQVSDFMQTYTISDEDTSAKFLETIPEDTQKVAELEALSYSSVTELLAERFHTTSETLAYLNRGAKWIAGDTITVPNVYPTIIRNGESEDKEQAQADKDKKETDDESSSDSDDEQSTASAKRLDSGLAEKPEGPVTVIVSKQDTFLNVINEDGKVIFHAPVTAGSEHDPLPIGDWKVNGTERYPKFNYNPELFWDAEESDKKAKLPAGPNNPVGVAWIDISKPHYGLHGTPDPSKIGYTQSHGCVRLTNWDVLRLADMVKPETKVKFLEKME